MIKKTITYETFDGEKVTEDFYFNLTKAELAELNFSMSGGFDKSIEELVKAENGEKIIKAFKEILERSVGRKSEDGKRFIKNDDIRSEFMDSNAYPEMFMQMIEDENSSDFVRGILPSDVVAASEDQDKPTKRVAKKA